MILWQDTGSIKYHMSKSICQMHISPLLLEFLFIYFKALVPAKSYLLPSFILPLDPASNLKTKQKQQ